MVQSRSSIWFINTITPHLICEYINICDALRDLVPFEQFKKCEKHPRRKVTFNLELFHCGKSAFHELLHYFSSIEAVSHISQVYILIAFYIGKVLAMEWEKRFLKTCQKYKALFRYSSCFNLSFHEF